jgi:ABC-type phosphate transport system permease subunit
VTAPHDPGRHRARRSGARGVGVNRWIAGTVFLVVGVILVGVAIALGG